MTHKQFIVGLTVMFFVQLVLCLILLWVAPDIRAHIGFIVTAMFTMVVFCGMMYLAARIMAGSKLTRLFIQLIMIAVFIKMLVCLALVVGYKKGFQPEDDSFIWPFLLIYATTTIYEVIFLEKIGRQKQTPVT